MDVDEFDEDEYDEDDENYNNDILIDTENLPVLRLMTPLNTEASGFYGRSFAYFSLKERIPVILTKLIDYLAREGSKIPNASSRDVQQFMQSVVKLKNDLVTNKEYDPFTVDTPNAKKWNRWIESQENKKYFLNSWMFTECYIYRKLKEGCELTKSLKEFDYFENQKNKSFTQNVEIMCLVADKVVTMVNKSERDKRKVDFNTLLKICLWANRCDLSLSLGSQVDLVQAAKDATEKIRLNPPPPPAKKGKAKKGKGAAAAGPIIISADPFQMILDLKDKVLVDDANKIADQVVNKAEKKAEQVTAAKNATTFKGKCSCHRLATKAGVPQCHQEVPPEPAGQTDGKDDTKNVATETKEELPKIPCPAKLTVPQAVMFDIVCDNAGYELFADLCLAHFLIGQEIVQKVRFHVKDMPWFISDVTMKDFHYVIDACCNSQYSAPSSTGATEGESAEPKIITAENLRALGQQWKQYVEDGVFLVMAEEFWTTPHCYKDMKRLDPNLYRKLQLSVAIMFKGDLNYRKLMGDINCNPSLGFLAALQGFIPAPIIAVRTVKAETICGLPRGKWDLLTQHDPKWMQSGDYGVIQLCPKAESLKVSDRPCIDYCTTCFGIICPEHKDM